MSSGTCRWQAWTASAHADYEANLIADAVQPLDLAAVVKTIERHVPEDTVYTNGAGNFSGWLHRFHRYAGLRHGQRTQLAPTSGAMGYGVPAGIAAKLLAPERTVVVLAGDGDFQMTGQELATAVQERAGVMFVVVDNGMYGTIRMHQERTFPGRVSGTGLVNPDFAALAASYGVFAERIDTTAAFERGLARALAFIEEQRLPALLVLVADPLILTPAMVLTSKA